MVNILDAHVAVIMSSVCKMPVVLAQPVANTALFNSRYVVTQLAVHTCNPTGNVVPPLHVVKLAVNWEAY